MKSSNWQILVERVTEQGIRVTLIWLYNRIFTSITGAPLLRYGEIAPGIFVGPRYGWTGKHLLKSCAINSCVNMCAEFDSCTNGLALANYCYLPTRDEFAPTIEQLLQGIDFIKGCTERGEKVYIHCNRGMGRAPTMAAAYLMSEGLDLRQAVAQITQRRPFIRLTSTQVQQLEQLKDSLNDNFDSSP